jgi:predicted glycogen debranching enzyme
LGGYAFGRADGVRTRRYHALLAVATTPPTGRVVLVNGCDVSIETDAGTVALSAQRYTPDVTHPDGPSRLVSFAHEPWPTWTYALPDGREIVQELVVLHGAPIAALTWRLTEPGSGAPSPCTLTVRPFLSGRDAHGEHHENPAFAFDARIDGERVTWQPYAGVPAIVALTNGRYAHDPAWYRNFQYDAERARGLGFVEDLAAPGTFAFTLGDGSERAVLVLAAQGMGVPDGAARVVERTAEACWAYVSRVEGTRRARFATPLHRAADAYVVRRGEGKTIVAGYPWFSDWGRDTFIALRGLCIAGGRLDDARAILVEWSNHVSEGMLPNFFPDGAQHAEYNSVDASLWYVVAVHEYLAATGAERGSSDAERLHAAADAIVAGYAAGTRYGIRADANGLLACGEPGVQLTWMDAKIGDWVVTPRTGKPVEIQALWINALRIAGTRTPRWAALADTAQAAFEATFWNEATGSLYDVADVNHVAGAMDATCRPNQIFAVGGLPFPLVTGERARRIVDVVEARLWTPAGLRSLAPGEAGYTPHYTGDMRARDAAYHQGTVWPWLLGSFVDAWVRVYGRPHDARERFLLPLLAHYAASAPGHVGEVADAEPPYTPGGCPFQAWSVGEALRVAESVLRVEAALPVKTRARRRALTK